ncbi:MAG: glycosyltransferase family 2 protein [Candidatus Gottesmanbacteria bacterium]
MLLSIIIPVYNEEKTIGQLLKLLNSVNIPSVQKEIILIDDGSKDRTSIEIDKIKSSIAGLKIIHHQQNSGKGSAIRSGCELATGNYIIVQDADLEYQPSDIVRLLDPIINHKAEVVYGTRLNRLPHIFKEERSTLFFLHYLGNRILSLLTSILYGQWLTDMETGYKVFPRSALKKITLKANGFDIEPELTSKLIKAGYHILEIPISANPRNYKQGKKFNTIKDGFMAFWKILLYRFT